MEGVSAASAARFIFAEDAKGCNPFVDGVERQFSIKVYHGRCNVDAHVAASKVKFAEDEGLSILWRITLVQSHSLGFGLKEGEGSVNLILPRDWDEKKMKVTHYRYCAEVHETEPESTDLNILATDENDSGSVAEYVHAQKAQRSGLLKSIFNISQKNAE